MDLNTVSWAVSTARGSSDEVVRYSPQSLTQLLHAKAFQLMGTEDKQEGHYMIGLEAANRELIQQLGPLLSQMSIQHLASLFATFGAMYERFTDRNQPVITTPDLPASAEGRNRSVAE